MIKKIAILGLLHEGPKHGYEIKRIVDDVLSRISKISTGATYHAIKGLEADGFIRSETGRDGARPERHVCHITESGREEFGRLLHKNLYTRERPYWDFNLSLFFYGHLDPEALMEALQVRLQHLEAVLGHVRQIHEILNSRGYGDHATFLLQHSIRHTELDIEMYGQLLDDVRCGRVKLGKNKSVSGFMDEPNRPRPPGFPDAPGTPSKRSKG